MQSTAGQQRPSSSHSSIQGIGPKLNCLPVCLSIQAVARKSKSWARDRMWCQFMCSPGIQSKSHQNQRKKLQLTSADADLSLQHGRESGLLCQGLPCSASAKTSPPATVTSAVHPAGNPGPGSAPAQGTVSPPRLPSTSLALGEGLV